MSPFDRFSAARPRILRSSQGPKTPEPFAESESQQPSPPRPRFRLKKRNASNLNAPTQQFLASVAAADVAIPSIEEPRVVDEDMADANYPPMPHFHQFEDASFPHTRGRTFSPKTPAPGAAPSLSPRRFPNWSIDPALSSLESSPEYESSRPSTAQSTQTSASLFSRISFASEDLSQCVSPEFEKVERFGGLLSADDGDKTIKAPAPAKRRKAPWTKPMSQHLWSTYMIYMQDPQVTPVRTSKSGIPPYGVCYRVSREAKRSWKGSNPQPKTRNKSGSTTPTVEASGTFVQWPHTCAATRAHLRELCKANAGTAARNHQYLAHSPTPFGRTATRFWNRRSAPMRSPSVFSGSDMAMSLAVATSDSMQRQGPLAQLTSSQPEPTVEQPPPGPAEAAILDRPHRPQTPEPGRNRLGSPFMARSYGPSSSNSLAASLGISPDLQRQNHTVGPRRSLRSPARLGHSRPGTQKRRSRQSLLEPRQSKRPSLASDFWTDPSTRIERSQSVGAFAEFSSTTSSTRDNLFVPRTNVQQLFETSQSNTTRTEPPAITPPISLGPPILPPPRLGSPFSAKNTSFSVPSRLSNISVIDFGVARRPFATVQQSSDSTITPAKSSLASRLAYIDERLKDLHRRDQKRGRSQSPL